MSAGCTNRHKVLLPVDLSRGSSDVFCQPGFQFDLHFGSWQAVIFRPEPRRHHYSTNNLPKRQCYSTDNSPKWHRYSTDNSPKRHRYRIHNSPKRYCYSIDNSPKRHRYSTHNSPKRHRYSTHNSPKRYRYSVDNSSKRQRINTVKSDCVFFKHMKKPYNTQRASHLEKDISIYHFEHLQCRPHRLRSVEI